MLNSPFPRCLLIQSLTKWISADLFVHIREMEKNQLKDIFRSVNEIWINNGRPNQELYQSKHTRACSIFGSSAAILEKPLSRRKVKEL